MSPRRFLPLRRGAAGRVGAVHLEICRQACAISCATSCALYDGCMRYAARTLLAMRGNEARGVGMASGHGSAIEDRRRELNGLLVGPEPAAELRAARDSGDLVELLPAFAPSVGYDQRSRFHALPLDEHVFSVVEGVADENTSLRLRLAALLHDIGKPAAAFRGDDGRVHYGGWVSAGLPSHEQFGAFLARGIMDDFGYGAHLTMGVVELVRWHMPREREPEDADRLVRRLGSLTHDLCALRHHDAMSKVSAPAGVASTPRGIRRLMLLERSAARLRP